MEAFDGITLTAGGAALGTVCTALVNIWRARNQRTEIAPDPLHIEQSAYQAQMKSNAHDHENMFSRISVLEKDVSALKAENVAQTKILDRMASQVDKLYDRIICGVKGGK